MDIGAQARNGFRERGFFVMPDALTAADIGELVSLFDHDRAANDYSWHPFGGLGQVINCDALVTSPRIDRVVRHPAILPVVEALLGDAVCLSEICLRHMAPYDGVPIQSWHRDKPHLPGHPLRLGYVQVIIYLSDVDERTHCFSISPESVDDPVLPEAERLAKSGVFNLHGRAGTVGLFNISSLHTATVRKTTQERKSIQIYYGHRNRPFLSNDSLIPPSFSRHHPDAETRAFYGNLNDKTRTYMENFDSAVTA